MTDLAGRRILIVDDEPFMRSTIKRLLWQLGKPQLEEAGDGQAALDQVAAFRPDLVLCDVRMQPMDGMEFVAKLRGLRDARLRATPVIMLTAHGEEHKVMDAARIGVGGYLVKPVSSKQLSVQIDAVLSAKPRPGKAAAPRARAPAAEAATPTVSPFLAEAIHELRTPLNAICGFSEAMKLGIFGPVGQPKYAEYVAAILAAGTHMQKIIDELLCLARAESGEEVIEFQPVDVGAIIEESAAMLRLQAEAGGVELKLSIAPGLSVRSDPTKLRQILLNLGSNAVKYTPRGGRVTIEAKPSEDGGALILVIRDTGIGIAPEDIETALRPFGRVQGQGAAPGVKGTGLGLPLTRRYVEQIGGTFSISSAQGKGTTITVRLPAEPAAEYERAAS